MKERVVRRWYTVENKRGICLAIFDTPDEACDFADNCRGKVEVVENEEVTSDPEHYAYCKKLGIINVEEEETWETE